MREKFIQEAREGDILIRTSQLIDKESGEKIIYYVSLLKLYKLANNCFTDKSGEKSYIHELIQFFNKKDKWEMDTEHSIPLTISGSQVIELDWVDSLLPDLNAEENDFYEFYINDESGEIWEKGKELIDKHEPFEKVMEQIDKNGFYKICIDHLG
jgi:hypothetical protein